jgi:hypothetical protein
MEIKKCLHCGYKAFAKIIHQGCDGGIVYCNCGVKTDIFPTLSEAIDVWNAQIESNPSEADRWFNEATEQRARADLLQMQVDELSEAMNQARRIMAYAGKLQ